MLTYERAHELFNYDPETGIVTRKKTVTYNAVEGDTVGTKVSSNGREYLCTEVKGKLYKIHRIVWLMCNGDWPDGEIDHINHKTTDNRIANLRVVSRAENLKNRTLQKNNTSGINGINWDNKSGKWRARVCNGGKSFHVGFFIDIQEAELAVKAKRAELGFHENHGKAHRLK